MTNEVIDMNNTDPRGLVKPYYSSVILGVTLVFFYSATRLVNHTLKHIHAYSSMNFEVHTINYSTRV